MLDTRVSLYVPSTNNISESTSTQEFNNRSLEIGKKFGQWFGGFTITEANGGWLTDNGDLVVESVKIVSSYTDKAGLADHMAQVRELAESKRTEWSQEAISLEVVEIKGGLDFI
jgi:hypothetical protein